MSVHPSIALRDLLEQHADSLLQDRARLSSLLLDHSPSYAVSRSFGPAPIWSGARTRATVEQLSMRFLVIRALELYASGRLDLS